MTPCDHCPQRRDFLKLSLGAAALLLPGCGSSPTSGSTGATSIANSANNIYTFPFATYSELASAGGSRVFSVAATSGTKRVAVTRVS